MVPNVGWGEVETDSVFGTPAGVVDPHRTLIRLSL